MTGVPKTVDSDPRLREVYKLVCARSDMLAAYDVAAYAVREVGDIKHPLWIPLLDTVTISYARPFTANRPFGPLPEKWGKFTDPTSQSLHEELIEFRHKLVAHSDADRRSVVIIPAGIATMGRVSAGPAVIVRSTRMAPTRFSEIMKHCQSLGTRLHEATQALLETIASEHDLPDYAFDLRTGERLEIPDNLRMDLGPIPLLPPEAR